MRPLLPSQFAIIWPASVGGSSRLSDFNLASSFDGLKGVCEHKVAHQIALANADVGVELPMDAHKNPALAFSFSASAILAIRAAPHQVSATNRARAVTGTE
jgi:hypothetical protein